MDRRSSLRWHELARSLLDEVGIGLRPHPVAFVHEVLEAEARAAFLHHERRPRPVVLHATDLDVGVVDVDPVVGERVLLRDDERDRQVIAVVQLGRGLFGAGGSTGGSIACAERAERHRRDHVRARIGVLVARRVDRHAPRGRRRRSRTMRVTRRSKSRRTPAAVTFSVAISHIIPGPNFGILELLDQARERTGRVARAPQPLRLQRLPHGA